jgi:hypothetical protein
LLVFKTSAFNRSANSPVSGRATAHCARSGSRIQDSQTSNIEFTANQANIVEMNSRRGSEPSVIEWVSCFM